MENCKCRHTKDNHFNAGERNICGGGNSVTDEIGCDCDGFEIATLKGGLSEPQNTSYHISISIRGALEWSEKDWEGNINFFSNDDGGSMTIDEAKAELSAMLANGREKLPAIGCDNFDYSTGCKGHSAKPQAIQTTATSNDLSQSQKKLIELDRKKPEIKKYYEDLSNALDAAAKEHGIDSYFQDDEGTVYKIYTPLGKFVSFEIYAIKRTKKEGEPTSGSNLSKKEAVEAGFEVK